MMHGPWSDCASKARQAACAWHGRTRAPCHGKRLAHGFPLVTHRTQGGLSPPQYF